MPVVRQENFAWACMVSPRGHESVRAEALACTQAMVRANQNDMASMEDGSYQDVVKHYAIPNTEISTSIIINHSQA